MIKRDVFHIRLKDIEIQTERIVDPRLNSKPIAIISSSHPNGSIMFLSSEAEQEGLSIGMRVSSAKKISHCTQLLPYNYSLYDRINHYIYRIVSLFTPLIEPQGIGQFFLDMHGIRAVKGNMDNVGLSIIDRIQQQTSLFGIVGISTNKLISSIITNVVPGCFHKVEGGAEKQFLSPLHPIVLPTVQEESVSHLLNFLMIKKVSQIQSMAKQIDVFHLMFGRYAGSLSEESKGYDTSPVKPLKIRDHIVEQTILPNDSNDSVILNAIVKNIAEKIALNLRKRKQLAKKVRLDIYYTDGYKRHSTGSIKKNDTSSVTAILQSLFLKANQRRNRVRSILVDVWILYPHSIQYDLFDQAERRSSDLSKAVEIIRNKYGNGIIQTCDVFRALKH